MKKFRDLDTILENLTKELSRCKEKIIVRELQTLELKYVNIKIKAETLFSEKYDLKEFNTEFGRVLAQLELIAEHFKNDPYSRSLIADNWHSEKLPCNVFLQFFYRNQQLDLICFIRSSDITRLTNDVVSLAHILKKLCQKVLVEPGDIHLFITSLHQYI